jgi:tetratricopeptide (TPR) repeat protein
VAAAADVLPDRYASVEPIGRGGMGEIFRATDTVLGRTVAIKLLDPGLASDEAVRERFTREAHAVARLSGTPGIVTIHDVGEWQGRPFLVMEYLEGGSLQHRLADGRPVPPGEALEWLEQVAAALDAAHRAGVIHRDVKPANLLLDRDGRVVVADFGIASATGLSSLTQTGTVLGTASYLSPEQAVGAAVSPASDRYSLAVVAFELLTGRRPFEGGSAAAEASAHVTGAVPSVRSLNPSLPREVDAVFWRALAKDPDARYGSCAELVAALRGALDEAAGATHVLGVLRAPRRQPRWLVPVLGLAALGAIGGVIAATTLQSGASTVKPSISVKTVTAPGTTVVRTVTTTTTAPTTTAAADPYALSDRAYQLMQTGDYVSALPLLETAVSQLQGRNDLGTAYANYNLGVTLLNLGRCGEAIQYLDVARALEPQRHEVHDALKDARKCSD